VIALQLKDVIVKSHNIHEICDISCLYEILIPFFDLILFWLVLYFLHFLFFYLS